MKIIIVCAVVSCLLLEALGGIAPDRAKRQVIPTPYNSLGSRYGQQIQAPQLPTQRYPQYPPQSFSTPQLQATGNRVNSGVPQYHNDGTPHVGVIDVDAPPYTSSGGSPQYHNDGTRHVGFIDIDGPARGYPQTGSSVYPARGYPQTNPGIYPGGAQGFNSGVNPTMQFPGNYYGTFYPG